MTCACLQTLVCNSDLCMLVHIYIYVYLYIYICMYVFCLDKIYTIYFFRGTVANWFVQVPLFCTQFGSPLTHLGAVALVPPCPNLFRADG